MRITYSGKSYEIPSNTIFVDDQPNAIYNISNNSLSGNKIKTIKWIYNVYSLENKNSIINIQNVYKRNFSNFILIQNRKKNNFLILIENHRYQSTYKFFKDFVNVTNM